MKRPPSEDFELFTDEQVERIRRMYNGYPTPEEQRVAADAVSKAYDAISTMCGDNLACPAPFDEIYATLSRHVFTIERLRKS